MKWVYVFIGGGLGSVCRFALSGLFASITTLFPWATLVANAVAAALIGWLFASQMKSEKEIFWQLFAVGFCGGLSTFSTFSLETIQLMRSGNQTLAWLYVFLSVSLSLLLFYLLSLWFQRNCV